MMKSTANCGVKVLSICNSHQRRMMSIPMPTITTARTRSYVSLLTNSLRCLSSSMYVSSSTKILDQHDKVNVVPTCRRMKIGRIFTSANTQLYMSTTANSNTTKTTKTTTTTTNETTITIPKELLLFENDRIVISYIGNKNDGIVHFELNRPKKMNALDIKMFTSIRDGILLCKTNLNIRVIILSGRGSSFCTGLDVKSVFFTSNALTNASILLNRPTTNIIPATTDDSTMTTIENNDQEMNDDNNTTEDNEKIISNLAQDVCYLWRTLHVPVIGCIHGKCYGGGLQILMGCDIRLCSSAQTVQFSIMESKWGLLPDMGATILFRELNIGIDIIKELTMTGRIFSCIDALHYGLITRIVNKDSSTATTSSTSTSTSNERNIVVQEAIVLAKQIIERSPDSIALIKHLYQNTWSTTSTMRPSEEYCLQIESQYQSQLIGTWNQIVASIRSLYFSSSSSSSTKNNKKSIPLCKPWWLPSYTQRKQTYTADPTILQQQQQEPASSSSIPTQKEKG